MRRFKCIVMLFLLVSVFAGCKSFRYSASNRILDFSDFLRLDISAGKYGGVQVKATSFIQAGGMFFEGKRFGMVGRQMGMWNETRTEMHLGVPLYHNLNIRSGENSTFKDGDAKIQKVFIFEPELEEAEYSDYRLLEVMAAVHLYYGIEVGIDLYELVDFFAGFFWADLCGDDLEYEIEEPKKKKKPKDKKKPKKNSGPREI